MTSPTERWTHEEEQARAEPICRPPHRHPPAPSCCVRLDKPPERPDLAIYSQAEQIERGLKPTWESPDILTHSWPPWKLLPETEVVVSNFSRAVSAVGAPVHLFASRFGIGLERIFISSQRVSLTPLAKATLLFPLPQELLNSDQHWGVHVEIELAIDEHPINNKGSQMILGSLTSQDGRAISIDFPVRNPAAEAQRISLATLSNELSAVVTPAFKDCLPFEQFMANLSLHVPPDLHGTPEAEIRREATVIGRDGRGALVDGLTYIMRIDN